MNGITTQSTLSCVLNKLLILKYIDQETVDRLKNTVFKKILCKSIGHIQTINIIRNIKATQRMAYDLSKFINAFKKISTIAFVNPLNHLKNPQSTPRLNHIETEVIDKFIHFSRYVNTEYTDDLYKAIIIIFSLALRTSEALKLKYSDISHERKTIKIIKTKYCKEGRILQFSGIFPTFKKELISIFSEDNSNKFILFTNTRSKSIETMSHRLTSGIRKIKRFIPEHSEFQLRDLRSTYAALAAGQCISENAIANFMGHKDTRTTSRHYSRNIHAQISFPDNCNNITLS